MATTAQPCNTCGRQLIKIPGYPSELCPVCQTVSLWNSKLKGRILSRFGQYVNGVASQEALQRQPSQTSASTQQAVPHPTVKASQTYASTQQVVPLPTVTPSQTYASTQQAVPLPTVKPSQAYASTQQAFPLPKVNADRYQRFPRSQLARLPPTVYGKKRAVLCGVTYKNHKKKLEASVHNVWSMQNLLVSKLGFPYASIRILTEEESDRSRIPTRRNIEEALRWLVQGCQSGDSLMFYYAGHGSQVRDENGDEIDGYDEALCPVDYRQAGKILDDDINSTIVAPLPHGVTLHSVIDTCFSGTVLDLPYLCKVKEDGFYQWEEHQLKNKGTSGGKALCISACADDQNSADTSAFTGNAIGALTFSFIQAMESESNLTYGRLLSSMRKKVRQAQMVVGRFAPFASSKSQEPQLSCSTRFEIYSEPVTL